MNASSKVARDISEIFSFDPALSSLACDHYHHHYHYQASAQYLWLAETLRALGLKDEANAAYDKAIFQDHLNTQAIERKNAEGQGPYTPRYESHPLSDSDFCTNVGRIPSPATMLHDGEKFDEAIAADANHSNSYFARGKIKFIQGDYAKAREDFEEAVRLSHIDHEAYHRSASAEHLARAQKFLAENELDLAITSATKALDLDRKNTQALKTRAEAYRAKGNVKQAEEDEVSMIR